MTNGNGLCEGRVRKITEPLRLSLFLRLWSRPPIVPEKPTMAQPPQQPPPFPMHVLPTANRASLLNLGGVLNPTLGTLRKHTHTRRIIRCRMWHPD
jgi:hypothetical protein